MKVINKRFIKNPDVLENEVKILSLLDHPNINRLYETYEDKNYLYLVNEYKLIYSVFAKEDNSSTESINSVASMKTKLDKFSFKWSRQSNIFTFRRFVTET